MKKTKRKEPTEGDRVRRFLQHSSVRGMHAMTSAAFAGKSPFGALLDVLTREAFATIAEEHYDWVKAEKGRKVVVEWEDDGIVIRKLDGSGKDIAARPILLGDLGEQRTGRRE